MQYEEYTLHDEQKKIANKSESIRREEEE